MSVTSSRAPLVEAQLQQLLPTLKGLSNLQREQLWELYPLYVEWNARINVISRQDIDNLYLHHVWHSLLIRHRLPSHRDPYSVADVGSGGGFPGIPLAILYPQYHFHLIDSIGKKLRVAQAIADSIGLRNVTIHHIRVEQCHIECDYIVSRAAMSLEMLYRSSFHLLVRPSHAPKSGIYCLKGGDLREEVAQAGLHHVEVTSLGSLEPGLSDYFREKSLLFIPV